MELWFIWWNKYAMKFPNPINIPKNPQLALWLNKMREAAIASQIQSSPTVRVNRNTRGTTLEVKPSTGGGSSEPAEDEVCPFDITLTPNGGDFDLNITPGTVNSLLPTDILTTHTYTTGSTVFVKIACTTDGKSVSSAAIEIDGTPPDANVATESEGSGTLDICVAVVADGVVTKTQGFCGSYRVTLEQVFLEDKASPSIGESLYKRWYQWRVEAET
jgi:hypothetical protein